MKEKQRAKLHALLREKPHSLKELSRKLKLPNKAVRGAIRELRFQHFPIRTLPRTKHTATSYVLQDWNDVHVTHKITLPAGPVPYMLTGDFHIGCRQFEEQGLEDVTYRAVDKGAQFALMGGDICDGVGVYPGQNNNLIAWKYEDQTDLAAEMIPEIDGFKWYCIGGNHDNSYYKQTGARVLSRLAMLREDIVDLGDFAADLMMKGTRHRLLHGAGGRAYAKSYPVQVYMRNLLESGVSEFPDRLTVSHYHWSLEMAIGNTRCVHPGNFQRPHDWYIRRGFVGPQGAYFIEDTIKGNRIVGSKSEWLGVEE